MEGILKTIGQYINHARFCRIAPFWFEKKTQTVVLTTSKGKMTQY
jgi:hypothetical protein